MSTTRKRARGVTAEELERLFASCSDDPTPAGCRDAAALALIYAAGLRRSDAVALDRLHLHDDGRLVVPARGRSKARIVRLASTVIDAVRAWLGLRGEGEGPLLCPVLKSGKVLIRRMTDQALYLLILRRAARAGVNIGPDDLRRTYKRRVATSRKRLRQSAGGRVRGPDPMGLPEVRLHVPFQGCGPDSERDLTTSCERARR